MNYIYIVLVVLLTFQSVNATEIDHNSRQVIHSPWESQFSMFPQSENGWSIIEPQIDSRLIYVSSSNGNDRNARAYRTREIKDPHAPPSSIREFKTIKEAMKLQRAGHSDWVLLKKGDEWNHAVRKISLHSGSSSSAPLVLTSYGTGVNKPIIKNTTFKVMNNSFIAIIGIDFYAETRDPNSIEFVGWGNTATFVGFQCYMAKRKLVSSILLEDNIFRFYTNNISFSGTGYAKNIVVRRNQILDSYGTHSHSQGIYAKNSLMLLEENLFDHNGWYQQSYDKLNSMAKGQATFFNHNAYLSDMTDTVIVGNIFSRASSMGLKLTSNADKKTGKNSVKAENIIIKDNFFVEGEIGISAGGNTDFNNGYRWRNISITNNVMLHIGNSQPTRRNLAWHINVNDWDGGMINNNKFLYNDNKSLKNLSGIKISGVTRNITVENNTFNNLGISSERVISKVSNEVVEDIKLRQNKIISRDGSTKNRRDLRSYLGLKQNNNGVKILVKKSKEQSKMNWDTRYTAHRINLYLK